MTTNYYKDIEQAFIDVLDGNSAWYEIQESTGLSDERCKEISELFNKAVKMQPSNIALTKRESYKLSLRGTNKRQDDYWNGRTK